MTQRALRAITAWSLIAACLLAVVICVCLSRAELPEGMHLANIVAVDTLIRPYWTPATRARDSLDSVFLERSARDLRWFKWVREAVIQTDAALSYTMDSLTQVSDSLRFELDHWRTRAEALEKSLRKCKRNKR